MSRKKALERALKLKALFEEPDFGSISREGEIEAAQSKFYEIVKREGLTQVELATGVVVSEPEFMRLFDIYGPYADLIYFHSILDRYIKIRPKDPAFNSYYSTPSLNFIPRVDTGDIPLDCLVEIPDKVLRKEIQRQVGELSYRNLLKITELNLEGLPVKNLTGVEFLKNLVNINIRGTAVSELSPLESIKDIKIRRD